MDKGCIFLSNLFLEVSNLRYCCEELSFTPIQNNMYNMYNLMVKVKLKFFLSLIMRRYEDVWECEGIASCILNLNSRLMVSFTLWPSCGWKGLPVPAG
jgi:hypothetical protein